MRLCWNAIVRNESKIVERCIKSLLPHVDCAIVTDTGSTDNTTDLIMAAFAAAGKPVEIHRTTFEDFSQARNEALRVARDSTLPWRYAILCDADMEFVVNKQPWFYPTGGDAYDVIQKAGSVSYWNRRLLSRDAIGDYRGKTHEYLAVESAGKIDPEVAHFVDHFDGASRPEKYARDIRLLEETLATETDAGLIQRATYYLAQTYFDMGRWPLAADLYRKRTLLGGFAEEVWDAQQKMAHCFGNMKLDSDFVCEMLKAYKMRPHRAEVLYDLAKYYRTKGDNYTSLLFSDFGDRTPDSKDDLLFVNHEVYATGLREEFSICAWYDPARRARGAITCDGIALSKAASERSRQQARSNQFWYLEPLIDHVPSFRPEMITAAAPDGYAFTNPSVTMYQGKLWVNLRAVNYLISPEGSYVVRATGRVFDHDSPIHTRNFLLCLDADPEALIELELPVEWPESQFALVRGLEDSRLFVWNDEFWTLSTVRELHPEGWCEMVSMPAVSSVVGGGWYGPEWTKILPAERRHEKNWMPWVGRDGGLSFVYRLDTLVDVDGKVIAKHDCDFDVGHISGGSQVIDAYGTWLALVHEARTIPGGQTRYYQHRFVIFDEDDRVEAISLPFVFFDKQIEFAAGMAYCSSTRQLVVSFGVRDSEAWVARMDLDQVLAFIRR